MRLLLIWSLVLALLGGAGCWYDFSYDLSDAGVELATDACPASDAGAGAGGGDDGRGCGGGGGD